MHVSYPVLERRRRTVLFPRTEEEDRGARGAGVAESWKKVLTLPGPHCIAVQESGESGSLGLD